MCSDESSELENNKLVITLSTPTEEVSPLITERYHFMLSFTCKWVCADHVSWDESGQYQPNVWKWINCSPRCNDLPFWCFSALNAILCLRIKSGRKSMLVCFSYKYSYFLQLFSGLENFMIGAEVKSGNTNLTIYMCTLFLLRCLRNRQMKFLCRPLKRIRFYAKFARSDNEALHQNPDILLSVTQWDVRMSTPSEYMNTC